jgi:hypothetical protein
MCAFFQSQSLIYWELATILSGGIDNYINCETRLPLVFIKVWLKSCHINICKQTYINKVKG